MKFCDKLQKIRKENNITQEGLADKLNVSRQAVSKWESGLAYPDTEKLIQISKIFNVSLDELINDNKDPNKTKNDKKFSFMETFNMVFDFISKSVSMFWAMKFSEKIKFLFEMCILIFIIIGVAAISTNIIVELVRRIFMFLPHTLINGIINLVDTLLYIAWIVLGFVIVVRVFKTRYLDYYVIITDENVTKRTIEEPIKELKEKREYKVVIRDPDHSNLGLLRKIGKLLMIILKCFCVMAAIPVIMTFVFLVIILVVSLYYIAYGIFFNGITITILGALIFTYLVLEFIYNLLFNRNHAYNRIFILFILSISLMGIGLGLSFQSLANFQINDTVTKKTESHMVTMRDNLIFPDIMELPSDKIIIDNNLDNIKVDIITYGSTKVEVYGHNVYDYGYGNDYNEDILKGTYRMAYISMDYNNVNIYKEVLEGLKNKQISVFDDYYEIDKVYISDENLTKLKENYSKYDN